MNNLIVLPNISTGNNFLQCTQRQYFFLALQIARLLKLQPHCTFMDEQTEAQQRN